LVEFFLFIVFRFPLSNYVIISFFFSFSTPSFFNVFMPDLACNWLLPSINRFTDINFHHRTPFFFVLTHYSKSDPAAGFKPGRDGRRGSAVEESASEASAGSVAYGAHCCYHARDCRGMPQTAVI
jgi:hypothetical protein